MCSDCLRCGSSGVPALFAYFMASSVPHSAATPPFLPALTAYLWWDAFIGFLGMYGIWYSVFTGAFALLALTVPAQVLAVAWRSVAAVAFFFPNSAVFALVLGLSVLFQEFLALELVFLGCTCGVAFLAPFDSPTLRPSPAVTNLGGFRCGPPHWLSLHLCVGLF